MKFRKLLALLCVLALLICAMPVNAALPGVSAGGNSFLLGSNLMCEDMNDRGVVRKAFRITPGNRDI